MDRFDSMAVVDSCGKMVICSVETGTEVEYQFQSVGQAVAWMLGQGWEQVEVDRFQPFKGLTDVRVRARQVRTAPCHSWARPSLDF